MIRAFGILKKACALVNRDLGLLPDDKARGHRRGRRRGDRRAPRRPLPAGRVADGERDPDEHERQRGDREPRDRAPRRDARRSGSSIPNDDVNRSQSSNDTFPTAMHIAAVEQLRRPPVPGGPSACATRSPAKADALPGRRQDRADAPPGRGAAHARPGDLRLGRASSTTASGTSRRRCPHLHELAIGGTAVGTGLNAPAGLRRRGGEADRGADGASRSSTAPNKFEALAAHDALVAAHGALKTLAVGAHEDRQRRPLARLRPALGPRRDHDPRERARQLDHAGQGQPDPGRRR